MIDKNSWSPPLDFFDIQEVAKTKDEYPFERFFRGEMETVPPVKEANQGTPPWAYGGCI